MVFTLTSQIYHRLSVLEPVLVRVPEYLSTSTSTSMSTITLELTSTSTINSVLEYCEYEYRVPQPWLTEWRSVSKKPFKMCFYPTLRMQIQPLNSLKTVSKVGNLSLTIATTVARSLDPRDWTLRDSGQECDLLWHDWLNWWVCPWVPVFEIPIFLTP